MAPKHLYSAISSVIAVEGVKSTQISSSSKASKKVEDPIELASVLEESRIMNLEELRRLIRKASINQDSYNKKGSIFTNLSVLKDEAIDTLTSWLP